MAEFANAAVRGFRLIKKDFDRYELNKHILIKNSLYSLSKNKADLKQIPFKKPLNLYKQRRKPERFRQ